MKVGKPKSKRTPVRLRNKIEKASNAKQRKNRKLARKNPEWRSRIRKDPGIPNLFPYKDKILHEIEESKRQKAEETLRKRDEARKARNGTGELDKEGDAGMGDVGDPDDPDALYDYEDDEEMDEADGADASNNPMAALLASANARAVDYNDANDQEDFDSASDSDASSFADFDATPGAKSKPHSSSTSNTSTTGPNRTQQSALRDLITTSDVVLYILDARDPIGTRSPSLERSILADPSKRLILVLNKIDLIPAPVLSAWLRHLRRSFPVLSLRAASSAPNAQTFDHGGLTLHRTASTLLGSLKTFAAGRKTKGAITVGIAGYPNVGKSSVVNALTALLGGNSKGVKGATKCPVGAEAGVTTALREVKLDGSIKLLDSPGVVPPFSPSGPLSDNGAVVANSSKAKGSKGKSGAEADEHARLVLLNAIPPHEIDDPVPAVTMLLQRLSASPELFAHLLELYSAPTLTSGPVDADRAREITNEFLIHVARKRGRLGKGGVPNLWSAAMCVVNDWRDGRIKGWVEAPVGATAGDTVVTDGNDGAVDISVGDQRKVVKMWAEEFKIEGLWGDGPDDATDDMKKEKVTGWRKWVSNIL